MPDFKAELKRRLRQRHVDPTRHFSVLDELAQHLDDRYRSLLSEGLSAEAAEQITLQEVDESDALERELRLAEQRRPAAMPVLGATRGPMASWGQDLRYALRSLRKDVSFTAVALITLAIGIGATTAIFSIVNAVMLRQLNYRDPERLVRIWESNPQRGWPTFSASHPNFLDWRSQVKAFSGIAATSGASFSTLAAQGAEILRGATVTVDFLPVLGVSPILGRNFLPEEDRPGGPTRVAILSHGFWHRRFGADPSVVGRAIALNGADYVIVGVLPQSFVWGANLDLLVPLAPDPVRPRADHRLTVIGRLRDGVTIEQAHAELAAIADALGKQYPESNAGWTVRLATFDDWLIPNETRQSLLLLLGAVAVVLLIACANVASLLLARGAARQKELSLRIALGAERWRIVRQLLTEALLLSFLAGLAGVALGLIAMRLLVAYGPDTVPRLDEASFDPTVLGFALAVSALAAFIFGLLPAVQLSRQWPADALRESSRGSSDGAGRQRLRSALTVAEVALSVSLLIGAGLLLRSLWKLQEVNPGFDVDRVMTLRISLPRAAFLESGVRAAFHEQLLAGVRALPGVTGAAVTSGVPLAGGNTATEVQIPGAERQPGSLPSADWRMVSPGYFATMGIPLRGRDFDSADRIDAQPVTIISETMARLYWPGEDAIGKTVTLGSFGNRVHTIVGVANDVRSADLDTDPRPMVYYSTTAINAFNPVNLVWRSNIDPVSHTAAVRDIIRRIDHTAPIYDVRTLNEIWSNSFAPRRFNMYLLAVFASVALLLAAIGLFGVMAYLVAQRTREIGVRLALGATRVDIFRIILGRGVVLTVVGALVGVGGASWLTRVMQSLLFSISATDPGTFAAVPLLLIIVACVACYIPARRAMGVDPVTALRVE